MSKSRKAPVKPHIVYLHCHDTGRYVQPHGHAVPTPAIQQLAESGVLFRNMHCASPSCSPSRAALLTGLYPHCAGMQGLVNRGFELGEKEKHLARWLTRHGYHTILAGLQHVASDPAALGYETILPGGCLSSEQVARNGLEALDSCGQQPVFLDIGLFDTHRPFADSSLSCNPDYVLPPALLPDTLEVRRDMAGFITEAGRFDRAVQAVMEGLRARELLHDTLILCTTDHGIAFPSMKCNLTVHGTGVFCILSWPGRLKRGVCDGLASQIDLFPTLCALVDIPTPDWLQGKTLTPLLRGDAVQVHTHIFTEVSYHCSYEPQRAVRTPRYAYIRRYASRESVHCANCDEGYAKELWLDNGWQQRHLDSEQLYDTLFDPVETRNQATDPSCGPVLEQLRGLLEGWQRETGDPILTGPIISPGQTNTPDGQVYVSEDTDRYTYDLWGRIPQPKGYA